MSVTYIPAPDIGRDLLDAYQTISSVKAKQQQLAIEQQLASSHLQDAAAQRELLAQKTKMATAEADEFTSPSSTFARQRKQQQDVALGDQAVAEGQHRANITNPLLDTGMGLQNQQHQISVDTAKAQFDHLQTMFDNQDELMKQNIKAARAEAEMKGVNTNIAKLLAPVHAAEGFQQLQQNQQNLKLGQQQIDMGAKNLANYDENQKTMKLGKVLQQAIESGNPQALSGEYPEFQSLLSKIPATVGMKDPKNMVMRALYNQGMETGDDQTLTALSDMLDKNSLTPQQQQSQEMMKMLNPNYVPPTSSRDAIFKALKHLHDNPSSRPKGGLFDDQTSPMVNEETLGGGSTGQPTQGAVPQSGTTTLSNKPGVIGQALMNKTGKVEGGGTAPQATTTQVQSGTQNLDPMKDPVGKQALTAFDDIDKWIGQHKEDASKTYHSNSKDGKSGSDFIAAHPADVEYQVGQDGAIYNSTKYETSKAKTDSANGAPGATMRAQSGSMMPTPPSSSTPKSSLADSDFQALVSDNMVKDPSATSAQEARYRAILGQMSRGFDKSGVNGLKTVASVVREKYKKGVDTGITDAQANHIAQIVRHYGVQLGN